MSAEPNSADSGGCKVQFSVLQKGATDPIPLSVTISVENGTMSIKATDGTDEYVGTLIFRFKDSGGGGIGMKPLGGDQCIICDDDGKNCRVVSPCPKTGSIGD
jgi:hypothetical protein